MGGAEARSALSEARERERPTHELHPLDQVARLVPHELHKVVLVPRLDPLSLALCGEPERQVLVALWEARVRPEGRDLALAELGREPRVDDQKRRMSGIEKSTMAMRSRPRPNAPPLLVADAWERERAGGGEVGGGGR